MWTIDARAHPGPFAPVHFVTAPRRHIPARGLSSYGAARGDSRCPRSVNLLMPPAHRPPSEIDLQQLLLQYLSPLIAIILSADPGFKTESLAVRM